MCLENLQLEGQLSSHDSVITMMTLNFRSEFFCNIFHQNKTWQMTNTVIGNDDDDDEDGDGNFFSEKHFAATWLIK